MNEVWEFIDRLKISKDEKIIVACSGGPDSMFLLHLLKEKGYSCVCAHVNHKVRKESDEEYIFLQRYCDDNDIIFEGIELTDYVTGNFEHYARNFRYSFFKSLIDKYKTDYLFTAHHGDDLMETILMRLTRGSSLKGYSGFSKISKRDGYQVIRPLVYLTKDDIIRYNEDNDIPYRLDYTNDLDDYTRNRFRHNILPFLKEEDNLVHLRFLKFSEELKDTVNYIDEMINNKMKNLYVDNSLDLNKFKLEDEYIRRKIIYNILVLLYPDDLYLVNGNHIDEILKIINSQKPNVEMMLPNNIKIIKEYEKMHFNISSDDDEFYEYILDNEVKLKQGTIKTLLEDDSNSNYVIRLNSKNISLPIKVRSPLKGDVMQVKNMKGHKKINDIFIDMKVEKRFRRIWPVVTDVNGVILWLPGLKKSNFDIPIDEEYDIILRYEKGEK